MEVFEEWPGRVVVDRCRSVSIMDATPRAEAVASGYEYEDANLGGDAAPDKVIGEDGVCYDCEEDAIAGNSVQASTPTVVCAREVKEKKNLVIAFSTPGLKDVHLWIDIFGFSVADSHGKVIRTVSYPMLASWMIDNDLFQVQLVNKKGKHKVYTYLTGYHNAVKIKNRLWEFIDLYLKRPQAVEALQGFCHNVREGEHLDEAAISASIPLEKAAFIDQSLTKAKRIPKPGQAKSASKQKPAKRGDASGSKAVSANTDQLARQEAELRALKDALQKTIEEKEFLSGRVENLDAQLDLMQLESQDNEGEEREASHQLKEQVDIVTKEKEALEMQLGNALKHMEALESGDAGSSATEVLHYQQEAQQLAALMDEQHSIIDDLVKAKIDLEAQVAKESNERKQAEAVADAAMREAAAAVAEAEATGAAASMQNMGAHVGGLLDTCDMLRRDLASCRSEAEALSTAVPLMSAFAQRELNDFLASGVLASMKDAVEKYKKECKLRKKLYNELIELKGNIRVFCRVRPISQKELRDAEEDITRYPDEDEITVLASDGSFSRAKTYEFDKVFQDKSSQADVFSEVAPLIASVLDGYNFCIFAYGQTGSGKTYTMEGPKEDPGVNARAIAELFRLAAERGEDYEIQLSASVLEIYNEQLRDLLASSKGKGASPKLEAKLAKDGSVYVPGLTAMDVESPGDIVHVMETASRNRAVGATNMNEHSSRSHAMLSVSVTCRNRISKLEHRGKLHLVDLAGSERVSKSEAAGARLKEAQAINKSLSSLGDVIQALSAKHGHVPFRNSKLTYVLQDSLGGHSKVLMFVQASPAGCNVSETRCSLDFAARARNVELGQARATTVRNGGDDSTAMRVGKKSTRR